MISLPQISAGLEPNAKGLSQAHRQKNVVHQTEKILQSV